MAASSVVKVLMKNGLGYQVPDIFIKNYKAVPVFSHRDEDSNWQSHSFDWSEWEVVVNGVFPASFFREYCGARTEFHKVPIFLFLMGDGSYVFEDGQEVSPAQAKGIINGSLTGIRFWAENETAFFPTEEAKKIIDSRQGGNQ